MCELSEGRTEEGFRRRGFFAGLLATATVEAMNDEEIDVVVASGCNVITVYHLIRMGFVFRGLSSSDDDGSVAAYDLKRIKSEVEKLATSDKLSFDECNTKLSSVGMKYVENGDLSMSGLCIDMELRKENDREWSEDQKKRVADFLAKYEQQIGAGSASRMRRFWIGVALTVVASVAHGL